MTDTDMLNWLEENGTAFREIRDHEYELSWLDESGVKQTTAGYTLRDCILRAMAGVFD